MPNDKTDKSALVSQKITQKVQDASPAFIQETRLPPSSWFAERDIYPKNEQKLLLYWEKHGGRQNAVELPSDTVHLLRIIGEMDVKKDEGYGTKKYLMQFVGCPESKAQWWWASGVKETYIDLYEEWVFSTSDSK
ncbi:hypothetical protein FANTH_7863 [Fusarium anthophilum]|uniref:Uncharacterized protein n=1 Tax=Fusarium anthophilum TaxID=48485 RepID=A0A8H4ZC81_9HYPO|nr:hypothetical protein FANTH_7863 [Fusarium anthophilum]